MASHTATNQAPAPVPSASPQFLPPPVGPCGHVLSGPARYVGPCAYCDLYDNVMRAADEMAELLPGITEDKAVRDMYKEWKRKWIELRTELANHVYQTYGTYGNSEHCEPEVLLEQAENEAFQCHEEVIGDESSDNAQAAEAEATNAPEPSQRTASSSIVQRPPVTFAALTDVDNDGQQLQLRPEGSYRKEQDFDRTAEGYEPGRWSSTTVEGWQNRSGKGIDGWAEWENDNWHIDEE